MGRVHVSPEGRGGLRYIGISGERRHHHGGGHPDRRKIDAGAVQEEDEVTTLAVFYATYKDLSLTGVTNLDEPPLDNKATSTTANKTTR